MTNKWYLTYPAAENIYEHGQNMCVANIFRHCVKRSKDFNTKEKENKETTQIPQTSIRDHFLHVPEEAEEYTSESEARGVVEGCSSRILMVRYNRSRSFADAKKWTES
jgi:hypothetical protein